MSDTPRTDENLKVLHPGVQPSTWYVQAEFARRLERDLAAMTAERDWHKGAAKRLDEMLAASESRFARVEAAAQKMLHTLDEWPFYVVDVSNAQEALRAAISDQEPPR